MRLRSERVGGKDTAEDEVTAWQDGALMEGKDLEEGEEGCVGGVGRGGEGGRIGNGVRRLNGGVTDAESDLAGKNASARRTGGLSARINPHSSRSNDENNFHGIATAKLASVRVT